MGSENNKMNDGTTSFQPSEPSLCANGCGFFGSSSTMNLCSKCFNSLHIEQEQAVSAKVAVEKALNNSIKSQRKSDDDVVLENSRFKGVEVEEEGEKVVEVGSNRCFCCRKKVGVLGFKCRCGSTFCGSHRYAEKHGCTFDFKGHGKGEIEKANPVVKGDKLGTRI